MMYIINTLIYQSSKWDLIMNNVAKIRKSVEKLSLMTYKFCINPNPVTSFAVRSDTMVLLLLSSVRLIVC